MTGDNKVIVILGTTASGKTGLGIELARNFKGEIVSADSRQVYRGLDIGTGKDLPDYEKGGERVSYHLIDVVDPCERFSVADFQKRAFVAMDDIIVRNKVPIVVGGTGQYLEALVDNYVLSETRPDEVLRQELEKKGIDELYEMILGLNKIFASKINDRDKKNKRRLIRYVEVLNASKGHFEPLKRPRESKYEFLILGLTWPKEILAERIDKRLKERLEKEDMVGEVQGLEREGVSFERLEEFGLEYRYIAQYLKDELEYDEMVERIARESKKFAKRQMTWYRRWEKMGRKINWIKNISEAKELVKKFLK